MPRPRQPAARNEHPLTRGNSGVWQLTALYACSERGGTSVKNYAPAAVASAPAALNAAAGFVPVAGGEVGIPFNGSSDYLNGGTSPSVFNARSASFWLRWSLRAEAAAGSYAGVMSQWNDPTPSNTSFQLFSLIAINNFAGRPAHSLDLTFRAASVNANATVQYATSDLGSMWTTVGTWDGANIRLWTFLPSGVVSSSAALTGTFLDAASGASVNTIIGRQDSLYANMVLLGAAVWKGRVLSFRDAIDLHRDPWAMVRPAPRRLVYNGIPPVIDVNWSDTLTFTPTLAPPGVDIVLSDTVTFSETESAISVDADLSDVLTWTGTHTPTGDDEVPQADTLTWGDSYVGLPEIEILATDLMIWSDALENDFGTADTVTWLDTFTYDGEVFPDLSVSWQDTLTWDMQPIESQTWQDTMTWDDRLELPVQNVRQGETLTWADTFAPDVNLLAFARYRR